MEVEERPNNASWCLWQRDSSAKRAPLRPIVASKVSEVSEVSEGSASSLAKSAALHAIAVSEAGDDARRAALLRLRGGINVWEAPFFDPADLSVAIAVAARGADLGLLQAFVGLAEQRWKVMRPAAPAAHTPRMAPAARVPRNGSRGGMRAARAARPASSTRGIYAASSIRGVYAASGIYGALAAALPDATCDAIRQWIVSKIAVAGGAGC